VTGRRVDFGLPERFVGVDVPDSGDCLLTEQEGLEVSVVLADKGRQRRTSEGRIPRFGSQTVQGRNVAVVAVGRRLDPSEAAHVVEGQESALIEFPPRPEVAVMSVELFLSGGEGQTSGHTEVHDELVWLVVEVDQQVLASAVDTLHRGADGVEGRGELGRRVSASAGHDRTDEVGGQLPPDRLDFGEFGHLRTVGFALRG